MSRFIDLNIPFNLQIDNYPCYDGNRLQQDTFYVKQLTSFFTMENDTRYVIRLRGYWLNSPEVMSYSVIIIRLDGSILPQENQQIYQVINQLHPEIFLI